MIRRWGRPEPVRGGGVTVEIIADVSAFVDALNAAAESFARFAGQWTPEARALAAMRDVGARELSEALSWWTARLDEVYADLGLPRDPHIIRGEN